MTCMLHRPERYHLHHRGDTGHGGDLDRSNFLMPAAVELTMLSRLLTVPGVKYAMQIIGRFARAEAQRVYVAARKSLNERTRNTLKHSTSSHKW